MLSGKQENPEVSVTKGSDANAPNHTFEPLRLPEGVVEQRLSKIKEGSGSGTDLSKGRASNTLCSHVTVLPCRDILLNYPLHEKKKVAQAKEQIEIADCFHGRSKQYGIEARLAVRRHSPSTKHHLHVWGAWRLICNTRC